MAKTVWEEIQRKKFLAQNHESVMKNYESGRLKLSSDQPYWYRMIVKDELAERKRIREIREDK